MSDQVFVGARGVMPPDVGPVIQERVRFYRNVVGLSRPKLAERAGVNYTTILRIEKGQVHCPGPQTLNQIGKALGVTVGDLVGEGAYSHRAMQEQRVVAAVMTLEDEQREELLDYLEEAARAAQEEKEAEDGDEAAE